MIPVPVSREFPGIPASDFQFPFRKTGMQFFNSRSLLEKRECDFQFPFPEAKKPFPLTPALSVTCMSHLCHESGFPKSQVYTWRIGFLPLIHMCHFWRSLFRCLEPGELVTFQAIRWDFHKAGSPTSTFYNTSGEPD